MTRRLAALALFVTLGLASPWSALAADPECDPTTQTSALLTKLRSGPGGFIPVCSARSALPLLFCRYTFALPSGGFESIELQAPAAETKHQLAPTPVLRALPKGTELEYVAFCANADGDGEASEGTLRFPATPTAPVIRP